MPGFTSAPVLVANREEGRLITWANLATGHLTNDPFNLVPWSERTVHVFGTFGVGGNCRMLGSLDGTNYFTLTDPQGNDLNFTAARGHVISEAVVSIMPSITAGDGSTNLSCCLLILRKYKQ